MSPISEARKRANRKYNDKAYEQLPVRVPKGKKNQITEFAQERGKSLNGFVNEAIDEKMERDMTTTSTKEVNQNVNAATK